MTEESEESVAASPEGIVMLGLIEWMQWMSGHLITAPAGDHRPRDGAILLARVRDSELGMVRVVGGTEHEVWMRRLDERGEDYTAE